MQERVAALKHQVTTLTEQISAANRQISVLVAMKEPEGSEIEVQFHATGFAPACIGIYGVNLLQAAALPLFMHIGSASAQINLP